MNLHDMANAIFEATRDDPDAIAAIQSERTTLARNIATDANASGRIVSATVNGQSFTMADGMRQDHRLILLARVCKLYEIGKTVSRVSIPDYQ